MVAANKDDRDASKMAVDRVTRPQREASAAPDPQVLDLAHLQRYSMGDRALEADLLALFRTQVQMQANAIAASDDASSWKLSTHTLKGVARTLGAWQIARTAEDLESVGHDGEPGRKMQLLGLLKEQIAACEAAIDGLG